jgi:hypothetical protein
MWPRINGCILNSIFEPSNTFYLKETKYTTRCSVKSSTMYKLKVILIVYFLFSKKSKSVGLIVAIVKKSLLSTQTRIHFSYLMFLSPNMFSLKKTKYTTRCSVKSSTVYKGQFILFVYFLCSKKTPNSMRPLFTMVKIGRIELCFFF